VSSPLATIATLLTPPGSGAIAVIRLAGPEAESIALSVLPGLRGRLDAPAADTSIDNLHHGQLLDHGEELDDVVVSRVPSGHVRAVDICTHGGRRVVERVFLALQRHGAMFVDSRDCPETAWMATAPLDAEVLRGLTKARTARAVRMIAHQRMLLRQNLAEIIRLCVSDTASAERYLRRLQDSWPAVRMLLEGATVALVGPPNSGKSTLFNRLAGHAGAVVSPLAGTTRDWVSAEVEWTGVPITLLDTAGLRDGADEVEALATRKGMEVAAEASLRLLVLDGSTDLAACETAVARWGSASAPVVMVINKKDRGTAWDETKWAAVGRRTPLPAVRVSARNGDGVDALVPTALELLGRPDQVGENPCLLSTWQVKAVASALAMLPGAGGAAASTLRDSFLEERRVDGGAERSKPQG